MIPIALAPSREMIDMRHPIPLLVVAPAVRQDEVMAQINRVFDPRNEVIDMAAVTSNAIAAVEALAVLQVHQHGPHDSERPPFRAE
jgi:hypothetical protein